MSARRVYFRVYKYTINKVITSDVMMDESIDIFVFLYRLMYSVGLFIYLVSRASMILICQAIRILYGRKAR